MTILTMPHISIIIPTYNHGKELLECLESILNQTYQNFEIIVVDDGSTDNTQKLLEACNPRIKIIQQEHQGANVARNRGFRESTGQYLLFCDADVILEPEMLEKMVAALETNLQASYAYSSFKLGWKTFRSFPFDPEKLKKFNYISTMSLIKREHFPSFDEQIQRLQDWDLWLTMLEQEHVGIWLPEVLFIAKSRKRGMSRWLPSFFYKIPWRKLGIHIAALEEYEKAKNVIVQKHHL